MICTRELSACRPTAMKLRFVYVNVSVFVYEGVF